MKEITVRELKNKIDSEENKVFVLDVREPFEQYQSKLNYQHSTLIPIGELVDRVDELEAFKEQEVICLCRSGGRSAKACQFLESQGFQNVKNLKGGINQWAKDIDNSLPIY